MRVQLRLSNWANGKLSQSVDRKAITKVYIRLIAVRCQFGLGAAMRRSRKEHGIEKL